MSHSMPPSYPSTDRRGRTLERPLSPKEVSHPMPDPAIVVGLALKFGRLHGHKRAALPFAVGKWLTELADLGDPTCRLVLDWLCGDRADRADGRPTSVPSQLRQPLQPFDAPPTHTSKARPRVRSTAADNTGGNC
jgi:hypothetical protein